MKKIVEMVPDGACLFRSLACGLLYSYTGHVLKGSEFGMEETLGDCCLNVVARWLRCLVVYAMLCDDRVYTVDTLLHEEHSFRSLLYFLGALLEEKGPMHVFPTQRSKRAFVRYLSLPMLSKTCPMGTTIMGIPWLFVLEEPLVPYARRMWKNTTWGGEVELILLHRILQLPIEVCKTKYKLLTVYGGDAYKRDAVRLQVRFKKDHYDAIIG